jgi:hypothetical protein
MICLDIWITRFNLHPHHIVHDPTYTSPSFPKVPAAAKSFLSGLPLSEYHPGSFSAKLLWKD